MMRLLMALVLLGLIVLVPVAAVIEFIVATHIMIVDVISFLWLKVTTVLSWKLAVWWVTYQTKKYILIDAILRPMLFLLAAILVGAKNRNKFYREALKRKKAAIKVGENIKERYKKRTRWDVMFLIGVVSATIILGITFWFGAPLLWWFGKLIPTPIYNFFAAIISYLWGWVYSILAWLGNLALSLAQRILFKTAVGRVVVGLAFRIWGLIPQSWKSYPMRVRKKVIVWLIRHRYVRINQFRELAKMAHPRWELLKEVLREGWRQMLERRVGRTKHHFIE